VNLKHILLVEPRYYTKYPPLGLLKLSAYHKSLGNTVELVKGTAVNAYEEEPDIIYVTSLFTWAWKPVWDAVQFYSTYFPEAELWLGGLYASLMPGHAALSGINPKRIFEGIFSKVEGFRPDYSLVPEWNKKEKASIIFSSRGCIRACTFCGVSRIEGSLNSEKKSIRNLIWEGHKRVILFDNNFLASRGWEDVLSEIYELDLTVDFNQGLDARLLTERVAKKISKVKIDRFIRLSYDTLEIGPFVKKAIQLLKLHGIDGRNILVYALYNFTDSPQDLFVRIKDILSWGAVAYPMRFQPVYTLTKNNHIAPKWDETRLNAVQRARRVIGSGGAFPPYKGMIKVKVEGCRTFDEAFSEFMQPVEVIQ
jgi:hypothetical protein